MTGSATRAGRGCRHESRASRDQASAPDAAGASGCRRGGACSEDRTADQRDQGMDFEDKRAGAHAVRAEQRLKLFIIVLPEVEQIISEAAVDLGEIIADLVETFVEARTRQGEGEVVP